MAAGRRGRPYQVPEDSTSLRAATVNVDARVGWLLLMSRLHHNDPDLALGEQFNLALRSVGLQADRSAVSRWESGKVTPRYAVLVAYEKALGLRQGQLTSVVNALRRALGGEGLPAWMPILDPRSEGFHERLDALFESLLEGPATGPEWTDLGHHIAATDAMYVHGPVWEAISHKLVDQMARSVGIAYLQRMEAVRLLLEHRVAHPWLLKAVGDYLDDDAVQIVNDPMMVLEISPAREAAEVILDRLLTTQSNLVFPAAVDAAAIKIHDDYYSPGDIRKIEHVVLRKLSEPGASAAGLEELIEALPEDSQARLVAGSQGKSGHHELAEIAAHGERFSPDTTRRVSQRIADTIRDQLPAAKLYDEDKMTPRLIREGLFAARGGRMHFASIALVGSPFRSHLAAALADEIDSVGLDDPLAPRFARLLRYTAGPAQEESLLGWLPDAPPQVARDMALAVGHLPSDRPLDELVLLIKGEDALLDRALLYALGMRQAAVLQSVAVDEEQPERIRVAARWWMRQGGAVRV